MLAVTKVFADILLGIAACWDHRYKKIPAVLPVAGGFLGIIAVLFCGDRSMGDVLMGTAPGGIVLFLSFLTNEKIGYGDGMMLLALGVLLPTELCIMSFCVSLVLEAVTGLTLLVFRKVNGKSQIPFLPFLLLGYVVMLGVCR